MRDTFDADRGFPGQSTMSTPDGAKIYLTIFPWSQVVAPGATVEYKISAYDGRGQVLDCQPTWNATGGSISQQGVYTAGEIPGMFQVVATDAASGKSAKATVEVQAAADGAADSTSADPASAEPAADAAPPAAASAHELLSDDAGPPAPPAPPAAAAPAVPPAAAPVAPPVAAPPAPAAPAAAPAAPAAAPAVDPVAAAPESSPTSTGEVPEIFAEVRGEKGAPSPPVDQLLRELDDDAPASSRPGAALRDEMDESPSWIQERTQLTEEDIALLAGSAGFDDTVRETTAAVRSALQALSSESWSPAENPESYFDDVMTLVDGQWRYKFHFKVLPELSPIEVANMLEYAEATLEAVEVQGPMQELHSYLVMGGILEDDPRIEAVVAGFNKRLWGEGDTRGKRAFFAYSGLKEWIPRHPGIVNPQPDIRRIMQGSRPPPRPAEDAPEGPDGGRAQVLIVDDSPVVIDLLKDILRDAGYVVYHATDWGSFKSAILSASFATILLDISMPGITGDKMALFVHQFLDPPRPRILLHSGMAEPQLRKLTRRIGASGYICKGVSPKDLLRIVAAAVRSFNEEAGA